MKLVLEGKNRHKRKDDIDKNKNKLKQNKINRILNKQVSVESKTEVN